MATLCFQRLGHAMIRTKRMETNLETQLNRCLSGFDLTMMGIGNMVGSGIYIIAGTVIRDKAGPAVVVSFVLAGLVAFLNALCYAELGARIPKAGSAYTYTYIAGGEFLAFLIGWSVILEYVLSASSVAKGWSNTVDSLSMGIISNKTKTYLFSNYHPPHWLSDYPDFFAFALVILLTVIVATGAKSSALFNNITTIINLVVIVFTTITMFAYPYTQPSKFLAEPGGFIPFGVTGIIAGAGTCFYAYIGFDAVTVSAEEASNPKRDLPIATGVSVSLVTVMFVITSLALLWFVPWTLVDRNAAFPYAFWSRDVRWAGYITGVGSLLGLSTGLFTSMIALPRIVYAMAKDGLLPKFLAYVYPTTQVPLVAIILFGLLAAVLAMFFSLEALADFLSIGTLLAYTIVSVDLCILRYRNSRLYEHQQQIDESENYTESPKKEVNIQADQSTPSEDLQVSQKEREVGTVMEMFHKLCPPFLWNAPPSVVPLAAMGVFLLFACALCCLVLLGTEYLVARQAWAIILVILFSLGIILSVLIIAVHQQNVNFDSFKVPFVPFLPATCILLNIILIVKLSPMTWIRFAVWTAIGETILPAFPHIPATVGCISGLILYFGYGAWYSEMNVNLEEVQPLLSKSEEIAIEDANPPLEADRESSVKGRILQQ